MKIQLIMILLALTGCSITNPQSDDSLTISKTPYLGKEIRTDGFYYQKWDNENSFNNIAFFYKNGIVLNVGKSGLISEIIQQAENSINNNYKNAKGFWGLFIVNSNSIIYERWVGTEEGYKVYREEGNIMNDTTFVMTTVSRMKKGVKVDTKQIERIYYFKEFSPKPDSTNVFIK